MLLLRRLVLLLALTLLAAPAAAAPPHAESPTGTVGVWGPSPSADPSRPAPAAIGDGPRCTNASGLRAASESMDDCTVPDREPDGTAWPPLRAGTMATLRLSAFVPSAALVPAAFTAAMHAALGEPGASAAVCLGAFPGWDAGPVPGGDGHLPYLPTAPPRRG